MPAGRVLFVLLQRVIQGQSKTMKSTDIIIEIRKQAAVIRALNFYLENLQLVSKSHKQLVEASRIAFNKILVYEVTELRKAYGDKNYNMPEKPDIQPVNDLKWGFSPKRIIKMIKDAATMLQMKITTLAGDDGATDIQSQIIDTLQDALRDWRNCELGELLNCFNPDRFK